MRAIDTNILIRYLTADQPDQASTARSIITAGDILIPTTVLLECEWVLRSSYRFAQHDILTALRGVIGLPGISVEHPANLAQALDQAEAGMDFADALHLSAAGNCTAMLTFDRDFIRSAANAPIPVTQP